MKALFIAALIFISTSLAARTFEFGINAGNVSSASISFKSFNWLYVGAAYRTNVGSFNSVHGYAQPTVALNTCIEVYGVGSYGTFSNAYRIPGHSILYGVGSNIKLFKSFWLNVEFGNLHYRMTETYTAYTTHQVSHSYILGDYNYIAVGLRYKIK